MTGNGDELGDSKPHAQGATGDWLRDSGAFWKALGNSMWLSGLGRQEQKATLPYESVVRAWEVYGEPYQREILMVRAFMHLYCEVSCSRLWREVGTCVSTCEWCFWI